MRSRSLLLLGLGLLILGVGLFWWRQADRSAAAVNPSAPAGARAVAPGHSGRAATTNQQVIAESTAPLVPSTRNSKTTDPLTYRLSNTRKTIEQLLRDDNAVLLENALIDSKQPVGFQLPERLRSVGAPGSYIVQSRGALDDAFRRAVTAAGAEYVSYIPNNAWLVRATKAVAEQLAASPETQAVLPWEPVYKLKAELLSLAMEDKPLPPEAKLNLLVFNGAQAEVYAQLDQMQIPRIASDRSPFGTVVTVQPGADWVRLAQLPGVQLLERAYPRARANDLTRVRIGVADDSQTVTNYLGLSGTNVVLGLNDWGLDITHPDFGPTKAFALNPTALTDLDGHGTHVGGIMAGTGFASTNVNNARGSINPGTNFQYRGVAAGAQLFVQYAVDPDVDLQENTARTNVFISNNSWTYAGDSTYSLAAASYDAAVRDSLAGRPGSQSVLYVFAVGNGGDGTDEGLGGSPGSINSPATAKNVVSVGAGELLRDITNQVEKVTGGSTNTTTPWKAMTSSDNQVASFSGRGNVGIRIEGDFGRFKPDVIAPGTFVIAPRSTTWDEAEYYNPTNHNRSQLQNQLVNSGGFNTYPIFLPENTVGFSIALIGNSDSPVPFPGLPLFVKKDGAPTSATFDLRRTNFVAVPPDLGGVGTAVDQNWFIGVGNNTGSSVAFDIIMDIVTTNDLGNYFEVLSNLNNSIANTNGTPPHFYRYESGTSMATPAVSGTLGLMQEFFEQRLHVTNSPALMKALLINGARPISGIYDFQVRNTINYQGWGMINLANSLPNSISNAFNLNPDSLGAIKLVDQSPTNALATGQSHTRSISITNEFGRSVPLRITLVWTDPAANPAAGVKLVNDLDLVVTNRDTGDVYWGNDFPNVDPYNNFWDTNDAPVIDSVNNVENVYLSPFLGTNYDITVIARRVNVNAVTAHTNDVVQDYALVISSGNGEIPDAFAVSAQVLDAPVVRSPVTYVTNTINQPNDFAASFLENQRVGANTPLQLSTNAINGMTNQWRYFVVTNTTSFTNAAFLISQHTDLATPRMGVFADPDEATRRYADLDLYVTVNNAGLTNLEPAVVSGSFQSRTRNDLSGDEYVIFTNSVNNDVYYVGVKSEDQMGGQFDFFAIFSLLPLGAEDGNGFVRGYPMTGYAITEGPPSNPGGTRFVAITVPSTTGDAQSVRRIIVTNSVSHDHFGDLINAVDHNSRVVVLDNHRSLTTPPYPAPPGPYDFLYDDSGENDYLDSIPTDGPGSLNSFQGETPGGTWYFTYSDDALTQLGSVNDVRIRVERQCESNCTETNTIAPNSWRYFSRNIPVEATNFTVCVNIIGPNPAPLQLYIRKAGRPSATQYDFTRTIPITGGCLTIDSTTLPPLQIGRYFIGVFNPNATSQEFTLTSTVLLGPTPSPTLFNPNTGSVPLLDDAVTNYTQFITNDAVIAQVDVGLRIDHPRVSDLAVTLVSPRGTRVLLVENRGGTNTDGFGNTLAITNFIPVAANGGPAGQTNLIDTGTATGTVTIDYDFFNVPDQMTVYYESNLLWDTTMTNGAGRIDLDYGPGNSTLIEVRMNEFGNTNAGTAWNYAVSSYNNSYNYLVFTDNTNFTTTPIKFAMPPFAGAVGTVSNLSDFETPTVVQDYLAPQTGNPDGWDVLTNVVTVISNTAYTGSNSLALRSGLIERVLNTVPGRSYRLNYGYRTANLDGLVAWWELENNGNDRVSGNNGTLLGSPVFNVGEVGNAMQFDGINDQVLIPSSSSLDVGAGNGFTIEAWIKPATVAGEQPLVEWNNSANIQSHFWISVPTLGGGPGSLYANLVDTANVSHSISSTTGLIAPNVYQHVAVTYNKLTGVCILYLNGTIVAQSNLGVFDPDTRPNLYFGFRPAGVSAGARFNGAMDEVGLFNRALSGGEVASIFAAGSSGKCGMVIPPAICGAPVGAQIYVPGVATNAFLGNSTWQVGGLIFTATNTNTLVVVAPLSSNAPSGVLVDSFTLTESGSSMYVLPEESLKAFEGENAFGEWKLEILDTRTGAFNNVALLDWQLQFIFQTDTSEPKVIVPGGLNTNTVCAGQFTYYVVDVPTWVRAVTNQLFFADGPLNVYFNQSVRPTGTNTVPLDYGLLIGQTNGIVTLTPSSTPALIPGQRYYIGIENPSTNTCVTFGFVVDFDLPFFPPVVNLSNNVPYCAVNNGPAGNVDFYRFVVSSNSIRAQFELFNLTGDLTLLLRRDLPPTFGVFDTLSANVFTNDEVITLFDYSVPVALTPGEWYLGAANISDGPVSYCVKAVEWPVYGTNIVITNTFLTTNSFCLTWTTLPGATYTVEGVTNLTSTNWANVSGTITAPDYSTTFCIALPSPFQFFRVREGVSLSTYVPPPVFSTIRRTFRGVELTWGGPVTARYQVEWSPSLFPATWTAFPIPPQITSTTGLFQFLDDGSQAIPPGFGAGRYYRLVLLP